MSSILDILFGRVKYTVEEHDTEGCVNLLHKNGVLAGNMKKNDGYFSFSVRLSKDRKVRSLLDKSGIKVYSIRGEGFPFLLKRYKNRYGIAVGIVIFCVMLGVSKNYVWQLTFSGNDSISDLRVEEQLMAAGFGVGTYIPDVDFYSLCNTFLQQTEDFSYISVNMEGTTAKVELRERKVKNSETQIQASNLVARYSGQIESMTVYSGNTVVEKEAVVKEGELLVSGFLEKAYGFDIVRCSGHVYAYVTRNFDVEIPFERELKCYTGNTSRSVELFFFGRNIALQSFRNGDFDLYDESIDRERLVLFDKIRLPLILNETTRSEFVEKTVTVDVEEAKKEAERQLSDILKNELYDSEILERRVTEEVTETSYKLKCEVYCITDIALEKEIELK